MKSPVPVIQAVYAHKNENITAIRSKLNLLKLLTVSRLQTVQNISNVHPFWSNPNKSCFCFCFYSKCGTWIYAHKIENITAIRSKLNLLKLLTVSRLQKVQNISNVHPFWINPKKSCFSCCFYSKCGTFDQEKINFLTEFRFSSFLLVIQYNCSFHWFSIKTISTLETFAYEECSVWNATSRKYTSKIPGFVPGSFSGLKLVMAAIHLSASAQPLVQIGSLCPNVLFLDSMAVSNMFCSDHIGSRFL